MIIGFTYCFLDGGLHLVLSTKKETKKTGDLDYGQQGYLASKGVEHDEDIEFVEGMLSRNGDELKDVMKDEYVVKKLKSMKEARKLNDAIPDSKRGSAPARDKVDYWIKKGEMPGLDPDQSADQYELATDLLEEYGYNHLIALHPDACLFYISGSEARRPWTYPRHPPPPAGRVWPAVLH